MTILWHTAVRGRIHKYLHHMHTAYCFDSAPTKLSFVFCCCQQIVQGQLQLRYDIGSDNVDINRREQTVTLPVTVTDGDLHHVTVSRVGKLFKLSMDGGEGRYFAQHEG